MKHPIYPEGCPLPIRDGEHSHDRNHVPYSVLVKRLGATMANYKFCTEEDTMKALASHAFKMSLPFDKSESFSAVAIRLRSKVHREYDRVAVVDLKNLVPLLRLGLPIRWHLGSDDKPTVRLTWKRPTGTVKNIEMPVARLLFNAPVERYCRYVWSPLLLTEKAWFLARDKKTGKPAKNDPLGCLRLHHMNALQTKGEAYLSYRDVRDVLVPPEAVLVDLFATKVK